MLYQRNQLEGLYSIINQKLDKLSFSIQTQYKFLKLKKVVQEELQLYYNQLAGLRQFVEVDEQGQPVVSEDGGIRIKEEDIENCTKLINEINQMEIQLPDIYFSLDELENLGLTLAELDKLSPFIKE